MRQIAGGFAERDKALRLHPQLTCARVEAYAEENNLRKARRCTGLIARPGTATNSSTDRVPPSVESAHGRLGPVRSEVRPQVPDAIRLPAKSPRIATFVMAVGQELDQQPAAVHCQPAECSPPGAGFSTHRALQA